MLIIDFLIKCAERKALQTCAICSQPHHLWWAKSVGTREHLCDGKPMNIELAWTGGICGITHTKLVCILSFYTILNSTLKYMCLSSTQTFCYWSANCWATCCCLCKRSLQAFLSYFAGKVVSVYSQLHLRMHNIKQLLSNGGICLHLLPIQKWVLVFFFMAVCLTFELLMS